MTVVKTQRRILAMSPRRSTKKDSFTTTEVGALLESLRHDIGLIADGVADIRKEVAGFKAWRAKVDEDLALIKPALRTIEADLKAIKADLKAFDERLKASRDKLKKAKPDQVEVKDERCFVGFDAYEKLKIGRAPRRERA